MNNQDLIKAAKLAYYNTDTPIMSDEEYDRLVTEVGEESVGAPITGNVARVKITGRPMKSLRKVHSCEEVAAAAKGYDIVASVKCDGLSMRLVYQDGKLISANTRGDGVVGGDVTTHTTYIKDIPKEIDKKGTYIIDGEAIIYEEDFEEVNKNGQIIKNQRNGAAGALSTNDISIVQKYRLSFVAWDVIEGAKKSYVDSLMEARELGFTIVPMLYVDSTHINKLDDLDQINHNILEGAEGAGILCDGVVWRIDDLDGYNEQGETDHHFSGAVAYKFKAEEYDTELLDIEWGIGRTGVLTPVAIFETIDIEGTDVSKASLHNLSVMESLYPFKWYKGLKLKVFKSNMIIPQISKVSEGVAAREFLLPPQVCPICGGITKIKNNDGVKTLWCKNPQCEGKLVNVIDHFVGKKGLDVKGLSKATIEKLLDAGWLNSRADVFKLVEHSKEWENIPGFGAKSVSNIIGAIEGAKITNFESYLSSLGIPLIGRTVSKELAKRFSSYDEFREAIREGFDFSSLDGFGYEMNKSLSEYDYTEADEIAAMLNFEQKEVSSEVTASAAGIIFCITGKVNIWKNRDALKAYIESIGGKVVGSMSSRVNYLINNDNTSTSAKNVAAKNAGIPIITEAEFVDAFGQN